MVVQLSEVNSGMTGMESQATLQRHAGGGGSPSVDREFAKMHILASSNR